MGATAIPETEKIIQVKYQANGKERTCTRFSRTGNEIEFISKQGERLVFECKGELTSKFKEWAENRLNNYTNSSCKILEIKHLEEEI